MMTPHHSTVFVGRQPIYDGNLNIFAFELLFRTGSENQAAIVDGDAATSQLLVNSVVEIGLQNLVFGQPAFVNFTRNFLVGNCGLPFEPQSIVVEVLETVEPDQEVIEGLKQLRQAGFTIALDDYVESDSRQELLGLADIIKVDLFGYTLEELAKQVPEFKKHQLKLLAEKVETFDQFEFCKSLGFDYFQGYFLSRPQIVAGKTIASNQLAILQLLVKLRDPTVSFDEVVDLIKLDVSLSIKLLKYVNSIAQGVRRRIDSVRQAAVRLGIQKICQVVTLIAVGGLAQKPEPLLETALIRARMCEVLGGAKHPEMADVYFTVGLFSSMDAFLDRPLEEVLNGLPLATDVTEALLSGKGPLGEMLTTVMAFERGDWDTVRNYGLDDATVQSAYITAVHWGHTQSKATISSGSPDDL